MKSFSENSHSDLDHEPRTLKVNLAQDIFISNICVKSYQNPTINVGASAMTVFLLEY